MKKIFYILIVTITASCSGKRSAEEIQKDISVCKEKITEMKLKIKELNQELKTLGDTLENDSIGKFVGIEEIKYKEFNHFIEVQGKVDGDKNVNVYPQAPGMITAIYVKIGQQVSQGQLIASLNDAAASEQLKALKSQLNLQTEIFLKQKDLWDQKIGSEIQYLQSKTAKEATEAQVAALKEQIDMMRVKAPVSGTIEDLPVKVGQMAGGQLPVCRIVNFGTLKAVAEVAEAYTPVISLGDELTIYIPDLKKEIKSQIDFCSKYINPVNRTFLVETHFEGNNEMKANMVVVLKINDYKAKNSVSIPINLIQEDENRKIVFLAKNENGKWIARKTVVTVGQTYNGIAEITTGLREGDKIINSGYLSIEEADEISF